MRRSQGVGGLRLLFTEEAVEEDGEGLFSGFAAGG